MANGINNKYEYRSGLLDSLNVQHTASDVRNEDEYRKKVLNGLGVEYTEDDINQKSRYRAKVVEGLASSGSGGGESDFSTAEVTFENVDASTVAYQARVSAIKDNSIKADAVKVLSPVTVTVPLYKGVNILPLTCVTDTDQSYRPTTDGSIEFDLASGGFVVTGNGTIKAKGETIL